MPNETPDAAPNEVYLVNPYGKTVKVPAEQHEDALQQGYRNASTQEIAARNAADTKEAEYGTLPQQAATAAEGAASGLTFGLSEPAEVAAGITTPEAIEGRKEVNPTEHGIAEATGIIGPAFVGDEAGLLSGVSKFTAPELIGGVGRGVADVARDVLPGAAGEVARAGRAADEAAVVQRAAQRVADEASAKGAANAATLSTDATKSWFDANETALAADRAKDAASPLSRIIAKAAPSIAQGAVEGAIYGAQPTVDEKLLGNPQDVSQNVLADVGYGAMMGGGIGGALGITHGVVAEAARKARATLSDAVSYLWRNYPKAAAAITGASEGEVQHIVDNRARLSTTSPEDLLAEYHAQKTPLPPEPAEATLEQVPDKFQKTPFVKPQPITPQPEPAPKVVPPKYTKQPFVPPPATPLRDHPVMQEVPTPERMDVMAAELTPMLNELREEGMDLRHQIAGFRTSEVGKILAGQSKRATGDVLLSSLEHIDTPAITDDGAQAIGRVRLGVDQYTGQPMVFGGEEHLARARARGLTTVPAELSDNEPIGRPQQVIPSPTPPEPTYGTPRLDAVMREMDPTNHPNVGMSWTPDMVRRLEASGMTRDEAQQALTDAHRAGLIELRPESGLNRVSPEDMAAAPAGPQDSRLTFARRLAAPPTAVLPEAPRVIPEIKPGWTPHVAGPIHPSPERVGYDIARELGHAEQRVNDVVLRPSEGIIGHMADRPLRYSPSVVAKLEEARDELVARVAAAKDAKETFTAIERFKQDLGKVTKFGKLASDAERETMQLTKPLYGRVADTLERRETWGEAASRQQAINERINQSSDAHKNIDEYLRGKKEVEAGSADRPWSTAKVKTMLEQSIDPAHPEVRDMMRNMLTEHARLIDEAERAATNAEDESFSGAMGRTKVADIHDQLARARLAKELEIKAAEIESSNKGLAKEYKQYADDVRESDRDRTRRFKTAHQAREGMRKLQRDLDRAEVDARNAKTVADYDRHVARVKELNQQILDEAKVEHRLDQGLAKALRENEIAESRARNEAATAAADGKMKEYREKVKERDEFVKQRASLLKGSGMGGGSSLWAGIALAHHPVLAPLWLAAKAATSPLRTVKTLTALESANQRLQNRMGGMVKSFVNASSRLETAGRRETIAGLAKSHAQSFDAAQKSFTKHADELQRLGANPQALTSQLTRATQHIAAHAPAVSAWMSTDLANTTKFLLGKLPRPPDGDGMNSGWMPNRGQIADFNLYMDAANHPLDVLKQAANGTLTPEAVETARTCYPQVYDKMCSQLMEHVSTKKGVSYQQLMATSMIVGKDLTGTLNPHFIAGTQALFAPPPPKEGGKPGKKRGGSHAKPDPIPTETMLPSEKRQTAHTE